MVASVEATESPVVGDLAAVVAGEEASAVVVVEVEGASPLAGMGPT